KLAEINVDWRLKIKPRLSTVLPHAIKSMLNCILPILADRFPTKLLEITRPWGKPPAASQLSRGGKRG
ncbi:MAG: hypothetical protein K8R77_03685, partial [Anaerolineaceae bacterium]|nr:hypothetical protein [Anaerolineaceae bacterium]